MDFEVKSISPGNNFSFPTYVVEKEGEKMRILSRQYIYIAMPVQCVTGMYFYFKFQKTKQPDKERQKKETKDFKKKQILSFPSLKFNSWIHSWQKNAPAVKELQLKW